MRNAVRNFFSEGSKAETVSGVFLTFCILASVAAVMLESIASVAQNYGTELKIAEWFFTGVFTVEYLLRIVAARDRKKYLLSFYGKVDLLSVLPSYLGLLLAGTHVLLIIRLLRLLRMLRLFKLSRHFNDASLVITALASSYSKILLFFGMVLFTVTLAGALIYLVEGESGGFTDIPHGVYWAVKTMTTAGPENPGPVTVAGKLISIILMIGGFAAIAIPAGIVSGELSRARAVAERNKIICRFCGTRGHEPDAICCRKCGEKLIR